MDNFAIGSGGGEIWTSRHVEMPVPSTISLANYQKLLKASKEAGAALGITESTGNNGSSNSNKHSAQKHKAGTGGGGSGGTGGASTGSNAGAGGGESSYFSGFMSRVLNPTNTGDSSTGHKGDENDPMLSASGGAGSSVRPLRPPRNGCVATANSWMVAALECPGGGGFSSSLPRADAGHSGSGTLRLVTRWNVRRMSGGVQDQWMALPPPVAGGDGRIVHVFADPTGTHTLLSARNGEAYYHHSSLKELQKLNGFGRNADGTWPSKEKLNGISASSQQQSRNSKVNLPIQQGLSIGSYVTAVAWDRERGTEGTSRKILLGTSAGEIYEYMLVSPNEAAATGATGTKEATGNSSSSVSPSDDPDEVNLLTKNPVLLHQLRSDAPVTGLIFERLRTGLLVMCATSGRKKRTRFYTFYSAHNSSFRMAMADEAHASLVELPGSLDRAELKICNDHICMRTETGIYYGTIDRAQSGPAFAGGSMIVDSGILPYDGEKHPGAAGSSTHGNIPASLAVTPHHIIALENNEVRFINRVSQKTIQNERVEFVSMNSDRSLDESVMGIGELMSDIRRPDQVWLRKARGLVHISSSQEDRDVWKYTLYKSLNMPIKRTAGSPRNVLSEDEKTQEVLFEQAKSLCTNPSQKAVVTAVRAEYHLSQGRAELAAKYFSQCPPVLEPFADTAVRLALTNLGIDDSHAYGGSVLARESLKNNLPLITYLSDKMRVGKNNNDKMTCTMIGAWLTELYLHERDAFPGAKQSLTQFLSQNVHTMDAKTIMKILTSHDVSATDCAAYAAVSGDIATAVNAALRVSPDAQDGVIEALRILNEAPFEVAESLYYKYASTLLARAPTLAGKSFLSRYTHGLSPTRLLPSFMHYERLRIERKRANQVAQAAKGKNAFSRGVEESKSLDRVDYKGSRDMYGGGVEVQIMNRVGSFVDEPVTTKYLEGVIKLGCQSSAIFSFLISLYVDMVDEEPLYKFLSEHVPSAAAASEASRNAGLGALTSEGLAGPLDMSYALRTILGTGRHFRSAIKLYMGFGMRQQAVELALKVDPSLARELAQDSVELEERRWLWLMIAKSAASEGVSGGDVDVVSKVVSVLKDCGPDVLSIEDVLPFLPDFAQIDQIKDEICEALTSYSSKIEGFLKEMNDCDQHCDGLRGEISRLRSHRMELMSDARCALTKKPVLTAGESFYVFPSGYAVLQSALKDEIKPYLNKKQRSRVEEIEQTLTKNEKDRSLSLQASDSLQAELDGLIAAECPLTGSAMVESIDQPFADSIEIEDMIGRLSSGGRGTTASV
eukprot:jgi/Psemu1/257953/estExt_Genewise1Plus.C_2520067